MFTIKDDEIQYLIDKELDNALKYGKFHSDSEYYGVILEEIEEAEEEQSNVRYSLTKIWKEIKDGWLDKEDVLELKKHSINEIKELLQVCAVCDKQLDNMRRVF